jgi:hypothetical protein
VQFDGDAKAAKAHDSTASRPLVPSGRRSGGAAPDITLDDIFPPKQKRARLSEKASKKPRDDSDVDDEQANGNDSDHHGDDSD